MKSAVAPNIFATKDVSIGTDYRNARRVQSLQVLIKIIRSYSAEILRLTLLFQSSAQHRVFGDRAAEERLRQDPEEASA